MKSSAVFLVSILVVVGLVIPLYFGGFLAMGETRLRRFSSREELRSFLEESVQYYRERWSDLAVLFSTQSGSQLRSLNSLDSYSVPADYYSKTNIQVEGVDEADFIKTDGEYIYIASGGTLTILKAYPPEEAEILSQITLNGTISGIFINGNKLIIFEGGDDSYCYATFVVKSYPYYRMSGTSIRVYDVSNRANPVSTRNVTVDGGYFDSRMIGDYVYAVMNQHVYYNATWVNLPRICSDGEVKEVDATQVYYSNISDTFDTYTTVVAVNTQDDVQDPTIKTFLLGYASTMYVSMNNIYITYPTYGTSIHRIHIDNGEIEYVASGQVPGYVLNQFSMDEHNDYFRIATTTGEVSPWGESTALNHVYVLNLNLNIVGRLENLAHGEKIHSARFMGNRCYLVTFKKTDPLFVIDLSDPTDPRVLGELKITGYSDYLHPYDENHLIGIGKETVEAEEGNFAWYQGVKISLFDVSDVANPIEIDKYEIGNRGTDSPVLSDHKAFLFDRAKGLLVVPVSVAEINETKYPGGVPPYTYGEFVFQGAYVFNIALTEGLVLKGRITHMNATELINSRYYYNGSSYYVERSIYIDDVLYTISRKKIKMNNLEDLAEINEIDLP